MAADPHKSAAEPGRDGGDLWAAVGEALERRGWRWRALPVERLAEAARRVSAALEGTGDIADDELIHAARAELPAGFSDARSIVVAAIARPLTQAALIVGGTERVVRIPPHYAGYHATPIELATAVHESLAPFGRRATEARLPLKTLATGSGLARYGRNNVTYVPGPGSYVALAACVTDAPPPQDVSWGEPQVLTACLRCFACARICPTAAITGESFVIRHDLCLTALNESEAPFPEWVEPTWHTCAVGCLECQRVCPQNWQVGPRVAAPERFDAAESEAILSGDEAVLAALGRARPGYTQRRAACGLDYEPGPMARNIRAVLAAQSAGGR